MKTSKLFLAILLVIFALSSTLIGVTAQPLAIEDVVVPVLQNPVSLNGVLVGDEWNDAVMVPVTFRFYNATLGEYVANRTGIIFLKHDCVDLWIGVVIEDPTEDAQSWLAVFYDTNGDEYVPGTGDDEKSMLHPDTAWDIAIIPTPPGYDNDTDLGGTLDILGSSNYGVTSLTYEFVHPLASGDTVGNDPALSPGDEILAHFMAGDPEIDPMLYGMAYTEDWNYLFNLIITRCVGGEILPINTLKLIAPALLAVTIAATATIALLKRRRS
jgi:hypothetical protein